MNNAIYIHKYDINLIDWSSIVNEITFNIINQLDKLNLIENTYINLKNTDITNIIKHEIISYICNFKYKRKTKNIIFIQPEIISKNMEICNYCDYNKLYNIFNKTLIKIDKLLPICIYFSNIYIDFKCFPECHNVINNGQTEEILINLKNKYISKKNTKISFENIKKYAENNKLSFLSEVYFNDMKNKLLLLTT